jgi:hypothetical protein
MDWVTWTPTLRFAGSYVINISTDISLGVFIQVEGGDWYWFPDEIIVHSGLPYHTLLEIGAELERRNRESALKSVLTGESHE